MKAIVELEVRYKEDSQEPDVLLLNVNGDKFTLTPTSSSGQWTSRPNTVSRTWKINTDDGVGYRFQLQIYDPRREARSQSRKEVI